MDDNPSEAARLAVWQAALRGGVAPHGQAAPRHAPDEDSDLAISVERLVIEQSLPADLS